MARQIDGSLYISPKDEDVPLHALRYTCTERISMYLNKEVQWLQGMKRMPNFGGLAELVGLDGLEISEMARRENPGLAVLDLWKRRSDLRPTIGNLVKYLAELGRQDILTDMAEMIREEIEAHRKRLENVEIQCPTVSSDIAVRETNEILTIDDAIEGKTIYDVFVCFDGANVNFVKEMIAILEHPQFGFRLFVPGRNNLIGTNSNAHTTKIISERCRHMIVVLSNDFLQSAACEFQTAYAFSLSPGARNKKIVPLRVEECQIPDILNIMECCSFTNPKLMDWSWRRLVMSIMCPMPSPEFQGPLRFTPPPGSTLASWVQFGLPELDNDAGRATVAHLDSGFSSYSSTSAGRRRAPVTAPVCSASAKPISQAVRHNRTTPITPNPRASPPFERSKSPGAVGQVLRRLTQSLSSSKSETKRSKTTAIATPPQKKQSQQTSPM